MENSSEPKGITTFNSLLTELNNELVRLNKGEKLSYWPRYILRRFPLYALPFFMIFAFFFSLGLSESVGFDKVNVILSSIDIFVVIDTVPKGVFLITGIISFSLMLFQWWKFNGEYIRQFREVGCERFFLVYKLIAKILMIVFFISIFGALYEMNFTLYYGVIAFLILTVFPLLMDRTLGFTRRNERFKLFIRKLERLKKINASREMMNIEFEEIHVLEYMKILDDADCNKNQDTMNDTSFIISQLDSLKSK